MELKIYADNRKSSGSEMFNFFDAYTSRFICGGTALKEGRLLTNFQILVSRCIYSNGKDSQLLRDITSFNRVKNEFLNANTYNVELFCTAHAHLRKCIGYGKLRDRDVWVGTSKTNAKHVGPNESLVKELMIEICADLNQLKESNERSVDVYAELHRKFMYIHPFLDGNGRVGRALFEALNCNNRIFNMSPFLYRLAKNKNYTYEKHLKTNLHADLKEFFYAARSWGDFIFEALESRYADFIAKISTGFAGSGCELVVIKKVISNPVLLIDRKGNIKGDWNEHPDIFQYLFQNGVYKIRSIHNDDYIIHCELYFSFLRFIDNLVFGEAIVIDS